MESLQGAHAYSAKQLFISKGEKDESHLLCFFLPDLVM